MKVQAVKADSGFQKTFLIGYLFGICSISLQLQPLNENKNFKNYISILAIVN